MEEINLLVKLEKEKEILILDKRRGDIKPRVSIEKDIPLETEELINQAEKQLNLIEENKLVFHKSFVY